MEIIQGVFSVIGIVLTAILGYFFSVRLLTRQKKVNEEITKAEQAKLDAERKRIEAEVWQMVNDELRETIADLRQQADSYKGERTMLIEKTLEQEKQIAKLVIDLEEKDRQIAIVEETYRAATNRQNDKIKKVEKTANGAETLAHEAKGDTDKLRKELRQTGSLPEIDGPG